MAVEDPTVNLLSLLYVETDLEEARFVDAAERRLRIGYFMILVIRMGARKGLKRARSHAGLDLVDLSIWHGIDGKFLSSLGSRSAPLS